MEKVVLQATKRTVTGKQVGQLRRQGLLPAVIYGHNMKPTAITLDLKESSRILAGATASSIIYIELNGKENAALVREKQRDYIKNVLLHVDFQVVSLTEKIRAKVAVELSGLAPAVKDFNGVVVTGLGTLEVEALPQALPERFIVDVSRLKKIGDGLYVRDIPVPQDVVFLDSPDEMIVRVTAGEGEEVVVAEEGAVIAEPEVIEKGKKEEEVEE